MSNRAAWIGGILIGLCVGGGGGFCVGFNASKAGHALLEDLLSSEAPADVGSPIAITRAGFSLRHPGNWKVDTASDDYDPDHLFSLESPGSSFAMLIVLDIAVDPAVQIKAQVDSFVPRLLASPKQTPFTRWGRYTGTGVLLEGKILSLNLGGIRIFSHEGATRSFTVVEFYYEEDMKSVGPGLALIESSFDLKDEAAPVPE